MRIVTHPPQQVARNSRRAPAAAGDLHGAQWLGVHAHQAGTPLDNSLQLRGRVVVESFSNTEAGQQRGTEQATARGGSDEREARKAQANTAGVGPLVDDDVEFEVLHRRIKVLLDGLLKTMNLINEEHIPFGKIGEQTRQVSGFFNGRTAGGTQGSSHGAGQDVGNGGLSKTGRSAQEDMIQRLFAAQRRLDGDLQALLDLGLAGEIGKSSRPQRHL